MDKIDIRQIESNKVWEDFLSKHTEANFLQSWYWGEFQEGLGRKIFRSGFFEKEKLLGVMFSYIESSKRGKFLVLPGGPIIDWNNKTLISSFASELKRIASRESCVFVRCRPQLVDDEFSRKTFQGLGFKNAPMYLHAELTSQLPIEISEDELLKNMRKTTRYEIKKAQNIGVKVVDDFNSETVNKFIKLQDETAKRQKFVPFSKRFLTTQFDIFVKNDLAKLYTAKFEDKILAQAFIIFYGKEAVYHYGASTEDGRRYPGAYLIQWEAIREAKKRDITRYNFWGVAPEGEQGHRFAGISIFKRGFGGQDLKYLQAQDFVINKPRYLVNYWIEKVRRKARNV